jgi:hypothetical protein
MKKQTLSLITVLFSLCLLVFACRREINNLVKNDQPNISAGLLESAKIFNDKVVAENAAVNSKIEGFITLKPLWNDSWTVDGSNGLKFIAVPTIENHVSNRSVSVRRLFVFEASKNEITSGRIIEFIGLNYPVNQELETLVKSVHNVFIAGFDGAIVQYDLNYRRVEGALYEKGNKKQDNIAVSKSKENGAYYLSAYSLDANGIPVFKEQTYLYTPDSKLSVQDTGGSNSGGGNASGMGGTLSEVVISGTTGGGTGGGGGGIGGNPPPPTTPPVNGGGTGTGTGTYTIPAAPTSAVVSTIADYLKCFDKTLPGTITIYADQPLPSHRDPYILDSNNVPDVGHSFISITQGATTRFIGYYPATPVDPFLHPEAPGKYVNDAGHHYDVKLTLTANATQFSAILSGIKAFGGTYNLDNNNCTDFAISIANLASAGITKTLGTWAVTHQGCNPGDLGEDLRLKSASVKTAGTAGSNAGTCN